MKRKINHIPKITIITVCLNSEKYLDRCLRSVLSQDYPQNKIEHIVIDGGSSDKTVSIIKKYSKNLKYWHSKKDKGLYDAMNIGISKADGEIIGILNSDDFFYKNCLKTVSNYFKKNEIDFLFGSVLKKRIYHNYFPKKIFYTFNFYPSHSVSFFIKRKIQKKIGRYNINFRYSADRDLLYRLIKKNYKGMPTKKNEVFGKFNLTGISSKINFWKKNSEEIKIRISNKENIVKVYLLFIVYLNYFFFRKILDIFK